MNLLEECPPLVSSPALNYPESLLIARRLGPSSQRETDDDATEHIESRAESIPIAKDSESIQKSPIFGQRIVKRIDSLL